jgi:excisionase family DNA binding protein
MIPTMKDEDQMLNPREVADILGVHQKTVHLWLRTGKLTGVKISYRAWRIPRTALKEFIEKNSNISQKAESGTNLTHTQKNERLETPLKESNSDPVTTTPPHLKMKHYIRDIMGEKRQDEQ